MNKVIVKTRRIVKIDISSDLYESLKEVKERKSLTWKEVLIRGLL